MRGAAGTRWPINQVRAAEGDEMAKVFEHVKALLPDDDGQDLLEYAMLIGLIAVVAVGTVSQLGFIIKTAFWDAIVAANI